MARTLGVSALVFSFWQLSASHLLGSFPSVFFLKGDVKSEQAGESLYEFSHRLLTHNDSPPGEQFSQHGISRCTPENAAKQLRASAQRYWKTTPETPSLVSNPELHKEDYRIAHRASFGVRRSRLYSESWDEQIGLVSDQDDVALLRLEGEKDLKLIGEHLSQDGILDSPIGLSKDLEAVHKFVALTGKMDGSALVKLIEDGLFKIERPFIALPDFGFKEIQFLSRDSLSFLLTLWPSYSGVVSVAPSTRFPMTESSPRILARLRQHLHHLDGNYEFIIHNMARETFAICSNLVVFAANHSKTDKIDSHPELIPTLLEETLRGIVLGVCSLTWHGVGLDIGFSQKKAKKIFELLRAKESMTLRDFQRTLHLKDAATRDQLLEKLTAEGLVKVRGKMVTAISLPDYLRAIHSSL
ncbi:hypothetical protein AAFN60_13775 [Roseibacillus persicicus]|uniref:hypothetical protein n=1 Tax=Roseibacillus persicicus TaxID=454148 RepID=UPI00398AF1FE